MEQRKIIRKNITEVTFDAISYGDGVNIQEVLDFFNNAAARGAKKVEFYARTDYDGCSEEVEASTYYEEEESEQEYFQRLDLLEIAAKKKQIDKENEERILFEQLKKKYEK